MKLPPEVPSTTNPHLSAAEQDRVAELVADGLSIQEQFRPEPTYKITGQGPCPGETVNDLLNARRTVRATDHQ
jgi:hypothetical protein